VRAAEDAGFDAFFFTEFHQVRGGGLVSPLLVAAWIGAGTRRIRMGTLVLAGPLHDPVRLAEDAVMLDWASRGRLVLGVGAGHVPADFALFGNRHHARRGAMLDELLGLLEACWTSEPLAHEGEFYARRGQVTPGPFTRPRPPVWIGAHTPGGLRRAAHLGDAWVCDPQRDIPTAARLADEYRAHAARAERPGRVVLFREAWVDDSRERAAQRWAPHALAVHRFYYNVGTYLPEFEPWAEAVSSTAELTLDRMAPGRFLFGAADDVRAEAEDWFARTGAEFMAVRLHYPTGPPHEEALEEIRRFGAEVIAPLATDRGPA
jgi:alkanesulfonate monooxygenase SsuD/methylene tetrahydromethanopterin reductase-like flavin-dependent oxidoreductase (luciferase family)